MAAADAGTASPPIGPAGFYRSRSGSSRHSTTWARSRAGPKRTATASSPIP